MVAAIIAGVALVVLPFNESYQAVVVGVAIFFAIGILWFAVFGRHSLVLSPEEEFAVSGGKHGNPQTEGTTSPRTSSRIEPPTERRLSSRRLQSGSGASGARP